MVHGMAHHLRTELVPNALNMALAPAVPEAVLACVLGFHLVSGGREDAGPENEGDESLCDSTRHPPVGGGAGYLVSFSAPNDAGRTRVSGPNSSVSGRAARLRYQESQRNRSSQPASWD